MNECHLRVQLPGTFFCRNQRWWWRVRLPGENRVKSRSLRPDGAPCGTKSRKTAEALAFDLWQQALVVFALLLNDRIIYSWVHALSGRGWPDLKVAWAPLIAMLVWPWLFLLLDRVRQRSKIR